MGRERRQQLLLAVLLVVLAGAVYWRWPSAPAGAGEARPRPSAAARTGAARPAEDPSDVHLDSLERERAKPGESSRNLFRFQPKPAPAAPPPRQAAVSPPPVVPSGPPPPPPIPLKFIGIVESGPAQKLAVLSDGRGAPLYGKEGETVLGQYKILRIGTESIEMSYLDGRGRQTIRLSGS